MNPWFTDFGRPPTGSPTLLCLAGAGAFASEFHLWPQALSGVADVTAVVLPGRERRIRDTGITTMPELIDELAAAVRPRLLDRMALFGHSSGALVMFELTRRLRQECGWSPIHLFLSAQPGPLVREHIPSSSSSDEELTDYIRTFGGAPEDVLANAPFMRAYFPGMRADLALYENYRYTPEAALDCPITTYIGTADHTTTAEHIHAWRAETAGPYAAVEFRGDHLFLRTHLDELVADIAARLNTVGSVGRAR
ncbi:alpha/beta fold hydrolase [Nocardia sp. NBC_00565]|uniref:thioesterase II family protein n=1 Tax=Nocardia sp. NBC_00565 TaxID=2975993 RepID=UPI002E820045|nr:alpha/beta fold hydrolase [Nocardia sp. NBC_00565]WUC07602.1 alpha/beta fold hydrolase [Nocardia sp. NBC_00565]